MPTLDSRGCWSQYMLADMICQMKIYTTDVFHRLPRNARSSTAGSSASSSAAVSPCSARRASTFAALLRRRCWIAIEGKGKRYSKKLLGLIRRRRTFVPVLALDNVGQTGGGGRRHQALTVFLAGEGAGMADKLHRRGLLCSERVKSQQG